MKTLLGVVYDTHTLAIRRYIVPDDDREVLDSRHVGQGEAMATAPLLLGIGIAAAFNAVRRKTGREPLDMNSALKLDNISHGMAGGKIRVI